MPTLSRNIIISIVLAAVAAVALLLYTNQVRKSAQSGTDAVQVVVATHDITPGTSVDDAIASGSLAQRTVRQSDLANGAVLKLDAMRGQVVTEKLYDGDQVTASRLGQARAQGLSYRLRGNYRGIRLPFDPNSGLLGELQAGDHVDVLSGSDLVAPYAEVLAVHQPDASSTTGSAGAVVLQVTENDAIRIEAALANADGAPLNGSKNIWLALDGRNRPTYDTQTLPPNPGTLVAPPTQ